MAVVLGRKAGGSGGGGAPSGPAGGILSGTFPNPGLDVAAKGDLLVGTGVDTSSLLTAGANGTVPTYQSGQATGILAQYPPGYEFDYAEITGDVAVSATTAAGADTCITGASVAYDGSTRVFVEVYSPVIDAGSTNGSTVLVHLWDGATDLGCLDLHYTGASNDIRNSMFARRFLTPSNASHQFIVKAWRQASDGVFSAGAGGAATNVPAYLRVTKA